MEGIGTGEFGVYRDGEEGVDDGEGGGGGVDGEGEPCNAALTKMFCCCCRCKGIKRRS